MDLYCIKCSEPWDNDEIHYYADEIDSTYDKVGADFRRRGCVALGGSTCTPQRNSRTAAAEAMYDMLGDDMDGAAAMFEDMEYSGMIGGDSDLINEW